jgi:hypothetical protein
MTTEHHAGASPADRRVSTVVAGGQDGTGSSPRRGGSSGRDGRPDNRTATPAGRRGSAAAQDSGDVPVPAPDAAVDPWPVWARPQLRAAVTLAAQLGRHHTNRALATELYRDWYSPAVGRPLETARTAGPARPLAGTYRAAHAGSGTRILADGIALVDRLDAVGRDGWWRTWNDAWTPTDSRRHSVRVLLSPGPERLADFVTTVTAALLDAATPWLLACTTDPRRLSRSGSAVLYVPGLDALRAGLLTLLRPMLQPIAPPLCLPLAPGAALAEFPGTGASFGARRCQLIALALQRPAARVAPLEVIADVFAAHGIDPRTPYRAAPH